MNKLPRPTQPEELLDLKAATRRDLSLARANAFALITRVDAPVLSKYGSPSELGHFMPIDVLVDLIRDTGSHDVLSIIAGLVGMKLVPMDGDEGDELTYDDAARMIKESGEAGPAVLAAADPAKRDCLDTIGTARREIQEGIAAKHVVYRKLALRERRLRKAS